MVKIINRKWLLKYAGARARNHTHFVAVSGDDKGSPTHETSIYGITSATTFSCSSLYPNCCNVSVSVLCIAVLLMLVLILVFNKAASFIP